MGLPTEKPKAKTNGLWKAYFQGNKVKAENLIRAVSLTFGV